MPYVKPVPEGHHTRHKEVVAPDEMQKRVTAMFGKSL